MKLEPRHGQIGAQLVFGGMVTVIGVFIMAIMGVPPALTAGTLREMREQGMAHTATVDEKVRTWSSRPLRERYYLLLRSPEFEEQIRVGISHRRYDHLHEGDEVRVYVKDGTAMLEGQQSPVPWHTVRIGAIVMFVGLAVVAHGIRRARKLRCG